MNKIHKMAYIGLLTSLVIIMTVFLKIPTSIGYINLGDGCILASAFLLGPMACIVGGLGSAFADLITGYAIYIPATLIIKGGIGLAAGYFVKRDAKFFSLRNILVLSSCELLMVLGYFFYECMIYSAATAIGSVFPNLIQGVFGLLVGSILRPTLSRFSVMN